MNFKPLHDRVLVKRIDAPETTKGGIIIPDSAKEKPMEGIVEATSNGYYTDGVFNSSSVKQGDKIMFTKWSGVEITVDDVEYLVMKETDIIGIIN